MKNDNNNKKLIGFDRKILLNWMDNTTQWLLQGLDKKEIKNKINQLLEGKVSDNGNRSSRSKTITILMHIWVDIPEPLKDFRDEGLLLYKQINMKNRLALHWGMCMATYPFFYKVAEIVGRLLKLQGYVGVSQVQRRMKEVYGDRTTLFYAVQHVMRNMVYWDVLKDTDKKAINVSNDKLDISHEENLSEWLLEAILNGKQTNIIPYNQLISNYALFPFVIAVSKDKMIKKSRLEIIRQNLNEDIVMLKNT